MIRFWLSSLLAYKAFFLEAGYLCSYLKEIIQEVRASRDMRGLWCIFHLTHFESSDIANQKWGDQIPQPWMWNWKGEISNGISIVFKGKCHFHCGCGRGGQRESGIKWKFTIFSFQIYFYNLICNVDSCGHWLEPEDLAPPFLHIS